MQIVYPANATHTHTPYTPPIHHKRLMPLRPPPPPPVPPSPWQHLPPPPPPCTTHAPPPPPPMHHSPHPCQLPNAPLPPPPPHKPYAPHTHTYKYICIHTQYELHWYTVIIILQCSRCTVPKCNWCVVGKSIITVVCCWKKYNCGGVAGKSITVVVLLAKV